MKHLRIYWNKKKKKKENIEEAQERAREQFLGYGLLANCDKKRYGNVGKDLDNKFTCGDGSCIELE